MVVMRKALVKANDVVKTWGLQDQRNRVGDRIWYSGSFVYGLSPRIAC